METGYTHTQRAPLWWLLGGSAVLFFVVLFLLLELEGERVALVIPCLLGAGVLTGVSVCFQSLTVRDEGDRLAIRFGPLPLFRTSVRYDDIQTVEIGRTLILDGWGIHLSVRGGWVWNLWGRSCVVVHKRRGTLRIGTDDPDNLLRFLEEKVRREE